MTGGGLARELPRRIYELPNALELHRLFALITNETPATSQMLRKAIRTLTEEGLLRVKDAKGLTERQAGVQRNDDVVLIPDQRLLFYGLPR